MRTASDGIADGSVGGFGFGPRPVSRNSADEHASTSPSDSLYSSTTTIGAVVRLWTTSQDPGSAHPEVKAAEIAITIGSERLIAGKCGTSADS
jgi:hypothetical protein